MNRFILIGGARVATGRLMVAVLVVTLGLSFAPLGFLKAVLTPVGLALLPLQRRPGFKCGLGLDDCRTCRARSVTVDSKRRPNPYRPERLA